MNRVMKDSGIPWIGQIPEKWTVCRLKDCGYLYGGLTGKSGDDFNVDDNDNYSFFIPFTNIYNNLYINPNDLRKVKVEADEKQNLVQSGDLLFLMSSEDYDGIGKPSLLKDNIGTLYLNSFCKGFRVSNKKVNPIYLNFLFTSEIIRELVRIEAKGFIRINLRQDRLSCVPVMLPPLAEQEAIAEFLDRKCGEVDEMVALQEQVIEELKAYKQSIITEAVTKGLNPDAPMKPSHIDWIGEIPEHWELSRIKNVASLFGRIGFRGYNSDDLNKEGEGAITLSPSNMKPMGMDYSSVTYLSWAKYHESPEIKIQNNDLLLVKTGSSYGKVSYVESLPKEATINPQILRIVPTINSKFLGYQLQTSLFIYQVEGGIVGGTIPTISQEKIYNCLVVCPPLSEQREIADYLDRKCADIDALIALKQQKIEDLREYKKSLIYEYVTGKNKPCGTNANYTNLTNSTNLKT